eukprot:6214195-Pleurochrysis_carterae.AAC.9
MIGSTRAKQSTCTPRSSRPPAAAHALHSRVSMHSGNGTRVTAGTGAPHATSTRHEACLHSTRRPEAEPAIPDAHPTCNKHTPRVAKAP